MSWDKNLQDFLEILYDVNPAFTRVFSRRAAKIVEEKTLGTRYPKQVSLHTLHDIATARVLGAGQKDRGAKSMN